MNSVIFIRHGATAGNLERRYIGRTDEPLCESPVFDVSIPRNAETLYVSPMLRCRQTAELLFPNTKQIIIDGLRECDFGIFEGKTADELRACPQYAMWLDTGCTGDIPGGDSISAFKERCAAVFLDIAARESARAVIVTHGGVIMSVLERFGYPKRGFYDYHISTGGVCIYEYKDGYLVKEKQE